MNEYKLFRTNEDSCDPNEYKLFRTKEEPCDPKEESIMALKVFDQCSSKDCITKGPVISAEDCTCVILPCDGEEHLGRVVLPNAPIYLPEMVTKVKVIQDSFITKKIQITHLNPSQVKSGFWDVEVLFQFEFKLQLFDLEMNKLKILCMSPDCPSMKECKHVKNYILGSICYVKTVTLFGSVADAPLIASDLFPDVDEPFMNHPHVLVEAKAYLIDIEIKKQEEVCYCEDKLDGIYDEPILYIYVTIGILSVIKLIKLVNILVKSKGYDKGKTCEEFCIDSCNLFQDIEFPEDKFAPKNIGEYNHE